ncbi:MAG TPA: hypothetical protein VFV34_21755 [Blastocatellia bacterium]|nr:hypothetical protein [Blastocatellia bacterium]
MTDIVADQNEPTPATGWRSVKDTPTLPFDSFSELQQAVSMKRYKVGVNSLAATEWCDRSGGKFGRLAVTALSVLLIAALITAVGAAIVLQNYWLLAAAPIIAIAFYYSHPGGKLQKWVTVAGVLSVAVVIDLLLNGLQTAAILVAYGAVTFGVVRIAGYLNNRTFRRALVSDESLFLAAYSNRHCTLKDNENGRVYSAR